MLEYLILPLFIFIAIGSVTVAITLTVIHQIIKFFIKDDDIEEDDE
jgi:hypothetical protein